MARRDVGGVAGGDVRSRPCERGKLRKTRSRGRQESRGRNFEVRLTRTEWVERGGPGLLTGGQLKRPRRAPGNKSRTGPSGSGTSGDGWRRQRPRTGNKGNDLDFTKVYTRRLKRQHLFLVLRQIMEVKVTVNCNSCEHPDNPL